MTVIYFSLIPEQKPRRKDHGHGFGYEGLCHIRQRFNHKNGKIVIITINQSRSEYRTSSVIEW